MLVYVNIKKILIIYIFLKLWKMVVTDINEYQLFFVHSFFYF